MRTSLSLVPAVVTLPGSVIAIGDRESIRTPIVETQAEEAPYQPTFFKPLEWAFLLAACDRLIPADEIGLGALGMEESCGAELFVEKRKILAAVGCSVF